MSDYFVPDSVSIHRASRVRAPQRATLIRNRVSTIGDQQVAAIGTTTGAHDLTYMAFSLEECVDVLRSLGRSGYTDVAKAARTRIPDLLAAQSRVDELQMRT